MLNLVPWSLSLHSLTAESAGIWDSIWNFLSGPLFIGIYAFLLLVAVILLIGFVLAGERNRPDPEALQECLDKLNELSLPQRQPAPAEPTAAPVREEEPPKPKAPRFYMLNATDERMTTEWRTPAYDHGIQFDELCARFRNFCASRLGLYYDIADIRRFIAGLTVSHLMVMQGMSGT
ncbi:MAG: hypothetical protein IJX28_09675, partial [Clostridia bacterium]|nr:hypothetical protein [Clostridia bacterium]